VTPKTTKAKQRQKRKQSQEIKPAHSPKSLWAKIFSWAWKVFAGIAVILGVYNALHPRVSVLPSTYLDPSDPLKALFEVTNEGLLSLYNVKVSCAIERVTLLTGLKIVGGPNFSTHLFNPIHSSKEIASGESDTVYCPLGALKLPSPVDSAEIAIVVDYSSLGIHWPNKVYPFTTQRDINGQLHWIKRPLKK